MEDFNPDHAINASYGEKVRRIGGEPSHNYLAEMARTNTGTIDLAGVFFPTFHVFGFHFIFPLSLNDVHSIKKAIYEGAGKSEIKIGSFVRKMRSITWQWWLNE